MAAPEVRHGLKALGVLLQRYQTLLSTNEFFNQLNKCFMPASFQLVYRTLLGGAGNALPMVLNDVGCTMDVLHKLVYFQKRCSPAEVGTPLLRTLERQSTGLAAGATLMVRASSDAATSCS